MTTSTTKLLNSPVRSGRVVAMNAMAQIGAPAVPLIEIQPGATVREGQPIATIPDGQLGAPIHASIDGTIREVGAEEIVIER